MGLFFWLLVFAYWVVVDEMTFMNSVILAGVVYFALPLIPGAHDFVLSLVK